MASFRNAEDDASLDFSDNPALTDDSFKAVLAGRASSLISISVAGCSELTNEQSSHSRMLLAHLARCLGLRASDRRGVAVRGQWLRAHLSQRLRLQKSNG